jgi:hypothetical protein
MEVTIEKESDGELKDYEIESAMDTLLRAETIKADAKMMAAIKPKLEEKKKALEKITTLDQLKAKIKEKAEEKE